MPLKIKRLYRFGSFCLEPEERVLLRDSSPVPLTPKAFDLLLVLVEDHGHLVEKDQLMKRVWPDAFVEESNLTYNISILRRTLGEDGDGEGFIETVPKRGYRFVAPVREEQESPAALIEPGRRRRRLWIPAGVSAVAVAGFALWLIWPGSRGRPASVVPAQWKVSPLTTYPGSERYTSFSPDGKQMAFAWNGEQQRNFDIYLQPTAGGTPVQLTTDPAHDLSPTWSPDGRWIAFIRLRNPTPLGILGAGEIFLTAVPGGPERKIGETRVPPALELVYGSHLGWSPDSQWLVVPDRSSPSEPRGLFLLSIQTGEKRRLTRAQDMAQSDQAPAFSPDGRHLAFIRFLSFTVTELYLMDVSKDLNPVGEPPRVTVERRLTSSPVWTADSHEVLFLSGHLWSDRSLWSVVASGSEKPRRLASIEENAALLAIAPAATRGDLRLAYTRLDFDPNIWQIELDRKSDGPSPGTAPRRLIASTRVDCSPEFSPDGTRIAFSSTRSGSSEIWVCNRDGSNPLQLTSFSGPLTGGARWSPDGEHLVFSSRPEGHADLYVVSSNGGVARRLTTEPTNEAEPGWSRDGQWIYYRSNRDGAGEIWKRPVAGGELIQVTKKGAMTVQASPDHKYVYYSKPLPTGISLWRVPSGGGEEIQVLESLANATTFALVERGIYFIPKPDSAGASIQFSDFATRRTKRILAIEKPVFLGLAVSPDGSSILYTQVDHEGSGLMQVHGFREGSMR